LGGLYGVLFSGWPGPASLKTLSNDTVSKQRHSIIFHPPDEIKPWRDKSFSTNDTQWQPLIAIYLFLFSALFKG
jgi:hypothetical protein